MTLRALLMDSARDYARDRTITGCPASIDEVTDHLLSAYVDELELEGERAAREFVRRAAKDGLGDKPRAERQRVLPGFDVPAFITVPENEGRVVYVHTDHATRGQAYGHLPIKEANIARALEERRKYVDFLDLLETVWSSEPALTVGQCVERLQ